MIGPLRKRWHVWLPISSSVLLACLQGRIQFFLAILATQAVVSGGLAKFDHGESIPAVAKTQSLFWSIFMILQCARDLYVHLFDGF